MENQSNNHSEINEGARRQDRITRIFSIVAQSPRAKDTQGAYSMVRDAFEQIENRIAMHPDVKEPMTIGGLNNFDSFRWQGKIISYRTYFKHVLFLGDNGSIELRAAVGEDGVHEQKVPDETQPYTNLPVVFQKEGADGKRVWEFPTS